MYGKRNGFTVIEWVITAAVLKQLVRAGSCSVNSNSIGKYLKIAEIVQSGDS